MFAYVYSVTCHPPTVIVLSVAASLFLFPFSPSPTLSLLYSSFISFLEITMGCVQSSAVDEEARARAFPFQPS